MSPFEGWGAEEPEFSLDSQRMGCHIQLSRIYTEQGGPDWEEVRSREAKPSHALRCPAHVEKRQYFLIPTKVCCA